MIRTFILVALALATGPLVSRGELLNQIDPRKRAVDVNGRAADVNGMRVNKERLAHDRIPQNFLDSQPVAPVTGQRVAPANRIERKTVDFDTLPFARVPDKRAPESNFLPKRVAEVRGEPVSRTVVPGPRAAIPSRVIRPGTAAGQSELVDQLKNPK